MRNRIGGRDRIPGTQGTDNRPAQSTTIDATTADPAAVSTTDNPEQAGPINRAEERPTPPQPPALSKCTRNLSDQIAEALGIIRDPYGSGYLQVDRSTTVHSLGDPRTKLIVAQRMSAAEQAPRSHDLQNVLDDMKSYAQLFAPERSVARRVAKRPDGIEIHVADEADTRYIVTAGRVESISGGTETLFCLSPTMRPLPALAATGDLDLLDSYLNLSFEHKILLKGWLSYTLATPRSPAARYLLLLLLGEQGTGKTETARMLQSLTDPSCVDVQALPDNDEDLAVILQQSFMAVFDNARDIKPRMSDALCIASTGGSRSARRRYTDDGVASLRLHGPIIVTSLHAVARESDLAERCLPLTFSPLTPDRRRDPQELQRSFDNDRPRIFRGLLDLISEVFIHLPKVRPINPERMYGYSHWLAAMERVDGAPDGGYQRMYSDTLRQGMLDSLFEDALASAVLEFVDGGNAPWSGTPAELYKEFSDSVDRRTTYSRGWPASASELSKQLRTLQAALRRQGVNVQFKRGRKRQIIITRAEGGHND